MAGGIGLEWYPDYSTAWSDAGCKNDVPLPFLPNSRPTYTTHLECCKVAFGGQSSGKCLTLTMDKESNQVRDKKTAEGR